jgi:hypothetical protein
MSTVRFIKNKNNNYVERGTKFESGTVDYCRIRWNVLWQVVWCYNNLQCTIGCPGKYFHTTFTNFHELSRTFTLKFLK